MASIDVKGLSHKFQIKDKYGNRTGEKWAVWNMDFLAEPGSFIAITGRNGSGKSTFARHLNGLLYADKGVIYIDGREIKEDNLTDVRQKIGMIFQNPDNQIVGNTVMEDVVFGPENLGMSPDEIRESAAFALKETDMSSFADRTTSALSGGQKQRLAIASILAMRPECIILDEASSMLEPEGAARLMQTVKKLNRKYHMTVIMITHNMRELVCADYIYVMDNGRVSMQGKAYEVLGQTEKIKACGLSGVSSQEIYDEIKGLGIISPQTEKLYENCLIGADELIDIAKADRETAEKILEICMREREAFSCRKEPACNVSEESMVSASGLSFCYHDGQEIITALNNISFNIYRGEIIAVTGRTGSGKSTMLQLLAGLIRTDTGALTVCGTDLIHTKNLKSFRKKLGFVFQFPEYQLFESTVLSDVAYGPINYGIEKNRAFEMAKEALALVGIGEEYRDISPFELSGGQKKRVAIAGILACNPEIILLDEPAAGLDRESKEDLFALIRRLRKEKNLTVIFVSHDMNDVYELADKMMVLNYGELKYMGDVKGAFADEKNIACYGISKPDKMDIEDKIRGLYGV